MPRTMAAGSLPATAMTLGSGASALRERLLPGDVPRRRPLVRDDLATLGSQDAINDARLNGDRRSAESGHLPGEVILGLVDGRQALHQGGVAVVPGAVPGVWVEVAQVLAVESQERALERCGGARQPDRVAIGLVLVPAGE